jgi:hypothetical protein
VDEHAPGAVEHEDSLGEKLLDLSANIAHKMGSGLKVRSRSRLSGSLGVF